MGECHPGTFSGRDGRMGPGNGWLLSQCWKAADRNSDLVYLCGHFVGSQNIRVRLHGDEVARSLRCILIEDAISYHRLSRICSGDQPMYIAMNRFRVAKGSEAAFEQVWMSRDSYLDKVRGFIEFHLL